MAYRMTPARRAALRKAQLASARKRKRGPHSAKSRVRSGAKRTRSSLAVRKNRLKKNVVSTHKKKSAYAAKHYSGPGGAHRMNKDRFHSRGAFSTNWRGKKYGRVARGANKVGQGILYAHPAGAAVVAGSAIRGKIHAKKKGKKRR